MTPVEIIFVLLGIVILLASCFVGNKDDKTGTPVALPEELTEAQKKELLKHAERIFEEKSEEIVVRTDDYLSKISNEKIMAVNDFSTQILEKIDANHKEVVFLYDMLNQKEDEIKQTVQQLDCEKQEVKEVVEDIILLTKQMKTSLKKTDCVKTTAVEKNTEAKSAYVNQAESIKEIDRPAEGQTESKEMTQEERQKEVLNLHKQGKSVLDISRALGMGQGEVKLIVKLYGA